MNSKIIAIIQQLAPAKFTVTEDHHLKKDLRFDSILLVQLAVKLNEELSIDLGAKADQGFEFNTVKDILKCQ